MKGRRSIGLPSACKMISATVSATPVKFRKSRSVSLSAHTEYLFLRLSVHDSFSISHKLRRFTRKQSLTPSAVGPDLVVWRYSRAEMRKMYSGYAAQSKDGISAAIAPIVRELHPQLPPQTVAVRAVRDCDFRGGWAGADALRCCRPAIRERFSEPRKCPHLPGAAARRYRRTGCADVTRSTRKSPSARRL